MFGYHTQQNGTHKGNQQSQPVYNQNKPTDIQHQTLSATGSSLAQRPWQYTSLDNVKVLYNKQDAQHYVRNMARTLEITNLRGSSEFIHEMLQRVDRVTKPTDKPFEYFYDGPHEKCYILVLIETKKNQFEIAYSYHSLTDELPSSGSPGGNMISPEPKTLDWFKARARQTLRIPAAAVAYMTTNEASMIEYQNQQLARSPVQQPSERFLYDSQKDYPANHDPQQDMNDGNNTMNPHDGPAAGLRPRGPH